MYFFMGGRGVIFFFWWGGDMFVNFKYVRRSIYYLTSSKYKVQTLPGRPFRSFLPPFPPITALVSRHLGPHPEAKISRA